MMRDLADELLEMHSGPLLVVEKRSRRVLKANAAALALLDEGVSAENATLDDLIDVAAASLEPWRDAKIEGCLRASGRSVSLCMTEVSSAGGPALVVRIAPADPMAGESDETALLRIAGRVAHFGGWRIDLQTNCVNWSDETAAIHGAPPGTQPSVEEGIGFFAPEWRPTIQAAFEACATEGVPYDIALQLLTAQGERVWTRTIGEAERDARGRIVAVRGAFQDISELVAAQERSATLFSRLERILENMGDGFIALDRDWRIAYANPVAARLVGQTRDALQRVNIWEAFPEAVGTVFETEYERAMETGRPTAFEAFFEPLDRWFAVRVHPYGEGLGLFFQDITVARAREAQLGLLEAAVARLNDIVLITEAEPLDVPDGPKVVWVNDAFERRTGFTRAEIIGQTPRLLQGPDTQRDALDRIREALTSWRPIREELINYRKDGTPFWLELDIAPIANAEGWFTHWVAVERDVTERKKADAALVRQAEMLDEALDAISARDRMGRVVYWNRSAARLYGFAPEEAEGGDASALTGVDAAAAAEAEAAARASGRWSGRLSARRADGASITVDSRWNLVPGEGPDGDLIVVFDTDMSDRLALEAQAAQSNRLEAVGQLTGGVAHDFNNLLTVILGNIDLLLETTSIDDGERATLETILKASERGAELIRRLLAFSRRQPLEPRSVDVAGVVEGMQVLLERTLGENFHLEVRAAETLPLAEIDAAQFESALLNLCLNARDAMAPNGGGSMLVEMAPATLDDDYARAHDEVVAGDYVLVSVTDDGQGMPPEVAARVFEPFFTTKPQGEGTGLGLSMVFGFVKQSGGHVKIYTEPGEGTTVRIYLPCALGEPEAETRMAVVDPRGRGEAVLLVEDDDLVRGHARRLLESLGYDVVEASDGPQALALVEAGRAFEILFTDVVMPGGMSGRDLTDRVLSLRPGTAVLYASGYTENAIIHYGRLDPDVVLLQKPYRRADLAQKLREVLDRAGR